MRHGASLFVVGDQKGLPELFSTVDPEAAVGTMVLLQIDELAPVNSNCTMTLIQLNQRACVIQTMFSELSLGPSRLRQLSG